MLLHFYAREGLVREPDYAPAIGQAARYLGREFIPASKDGAKLIPASHPALKDGFKCDADSDIARVAVKNARKGAFWPADAETAAVCGVAFVEVEFKDGVFEQKTKASTSSKASKAAE